MKLRFLLTLLLPLTNCLHYTYQENFTTKDSLPNLVHQKFISELKQKNLQNFEMFQKNKNNKIIQYSGRKYGYPYTALYDIYQKNEELFKIRYSNTFLKNDIHLEKINQDEIFVKVDVVTFIPIPQIIIEKIISRKLQFLKIS